MNKIDNKVFIETYDLTEYAMNNDIMDNLYRTEQYKELNEERTKHFFELHKNNKKLMNDYLDGLNEKEISDKYKIPALARRKVLKYNGLIDNGIEIPKNPKTDIDKAYRKYVKVRKELKEYQFSKEYVELLNKEKESRNEVLSCIDNETEWNHKDIKLMKRKYNKNAITSTQIIKMLGKDKALELFDIKEQQSFYLNYGRFDNKIKKKIKEENKIDLNI